MPSETIAIGGDHAGFHLKEILAKALKDKGYQVLDLGTHGTESTDYPDYAHAVAEAIENGRAVRGVLVCGSGIGVSMAANRHKGVRAANCTSGLMARLARQHNDANVLALGERLVGTEVALDCLDEFLKTEFKGGRHQARIEKL